ncbi:MAG: UV DNA damage repair endonuclease UvsE [Thermoplasmatota archaeon]
MKIGYPCIHRSIGCSANKTFRLASYSASRFRQTVDNNLSCLQKILEYNSAHRILFFRISSDIIPFASHPICTIPWQEEYRDQFKTIGQYIKKNHIRISMHPDQFIVLNSKDNDIVQRSINELEYHADLLDALGLDYSAKIQLHVGGVYNDKQKSINRFISTYHHLPEKIISRLVIENDDNRFNLNDCLTISENITLPILFDYFHHSIYHENNNFDDIFSRYIQTWKTVDGIPMCDYSSQQPNFRIGSHAQSIDLNDFTIYLNKTKPYDIDIMLEIKDKESSAHSAIEIVQHDKRFFTVI